VDECAMCMEPESFVPIVRTDAKHVVLVGDDRQLRPIVVEKQAEKRGLDRSLFERYSQSKAFMLTTQYRMHEEIARFSSIQFYQSRLTIGKAEQALPSAHNFWPGGCKMPIAFVHVVGAEESLTVSTDEGSVQSKSNVLEVNTLVRIVKEMVRHHRIEEKNIAVLSQYRAQCAELTKKLQSNQLNDVTVQTVISSQGAEWQYVLLSTVRSLSNAEIEQNPSMAWKGKHLGFITDKNQMNVALTRAQKGLIILGNKTLLRTDETWAKLLDHYTQRNAVTDAADFISRISP